MIKSDGKIIEKNDEFTVEKMLFTYDDSEIQENKINRENAKLVLNPKFIPFYPSLLKDGYTYLECLIYGFIDFFLSTNDRFYCTNSQLGELFNSSEKTISLAIKRLKDDGLISVGYTIKAGGGQIRFIKIVKDDFTKMYSQCLQKGKRIENKIIENKIIINNDEKIVKSEVDNHLNLNKNDDVDVDVKHCADLTFDKIYKNFYRKSGHKQDIKKSKKIFEECMFSENDIDKILLDESIFKIEYKRGVKDQMYRPKFDTYIQSLNLDNLNIENRIKAIAKKHYENINDGKTIDRYNQIKELPNELKIMFDSSFKKIASEGFRINTY